MGPEVTVTLAAFLGFLQFGLGVSLQPPISIGTSWLFIHLGAFEELNWVAFPCWAVLWKKGHWGRACPKVL